MQSDNDLLKCLLALDESALQRLLLAIESIKARKHTGLHQATSRQLADSR